MRRQWWFAAVVVAALLVLGALGNAVVTFAVAGALLVIGLAVLPRQRSRGAVAATVAGCVALALVLIAHWPR